MVIYKKIYEYLDSKEEAEDNNFYSVCILPQYVAVANSFLKNKIKISALIDFPKGQSDVKQKINSIDEAIVNGANEIDVVINYKLIKDSEEQNTLENEIRELTEYCHKEGVIIKIIIEIGSLNYQEIEAICRMAINSNVDFIMTSTGKLPNDDSFETKLEKVKFMRKILPDDIKIKFSGGIRLNSQIKELLEVADRIGTSVIIH